jgi:hypothetical protein
MSNFVETIRGGCKSGMACFLTTVVLFFLLFLIAYDFPVFKQLVQLFSPQILTGVDRP